MISHKLTNNIYFWSKGKGRKNKNAKNAQSDSENDHYDDDFDPKNPFGDDEIESFHDNRDKVNFK